MALYYIIFVTLFLISYVKRWHNEIFWGTITFLILFAGLRAYTIGTDTPTYKAVFQYLEPKEPLWYGLNIIISSLGLSYTSLLIAASSLTMIPLAIAIKRSSINPQLSIFIYYGLFGYLNSFNTMRQLVAVSFVLLAYTYCKKKYKCIALIIVAVGFHYSAIVALLIFLIDRLRLNSSIIYLFISFVFGCICNDSIFSALMGPYGQYLDSEFGYRENLSSAIVMAFLLNLLFLMIFYTSSNKLHNSIWLKIFLFGIIITNMTMQLVLGARIIMYFTMAQTVLYPSYFKYNRERHPALLQLIVFVYILTIFSKILVASKEYLIPYHFA